MQRESWAQRENRQGETVGRRTRGRARQPQTTTTNSHAKRATYPEQQTATGTATPSLPRVPTSSPSRSTHSRPGRFVTHQLSIRATRTSLQFAPRAICLRSRQVHEIRGAAFNAAIVVFNPMSHANPPARDRPRPKLESSSQFGIHTGSDWPSLSSGYPSEPTLSHNRTFHLHGISSRLAVHQCSFQIPIHYIIHCLRLFRTS
jgi:hypothetical protein